MAERLYRATPTDLEVRASGDGRVITGIAVPFDSPTDIRDMSGEYVEVFRRGAFARTIAERGPRGVKALAQHQTQMLPIGRAELLREDPAGLYSELRVSKTQLGDEVLELVRDGALDSFSIGFSPVRDQRARDGTVERVEVKLHEISVVAFPAYQDALISGVRSEYRDARARLAETLERYEQ